MANLLPDGRGRSGSEPYEYRENKTIQLFSHLITLRVQAHTGDSSNDKGAMAKSKKCVRIVNPILRSEGLHRPSVIPITTKAKRPTVMVSRSQSLPVVHAR